jgi:hypothetical protein
LLRRAGPARRRAREEYGLPHRTTPGYATDTTRSVRQSELMFTLGFDNERQTALTLGVVSAALTFVLTAPTLLVAFL